MFYIDISNGRYPLTVSDVKNENPNISFPNEFTSIGNYCIVEKTPMPEINWITQKIEESTPTLNADGVWEQTWIVSELEDEQIAANNKTHIDNIKQGIVISTQSRLDCFARSRGYDDVNSASKYKDITDDEIALLPLEEQVLVSKFRAECKYLVTMTMRTWAKLYLILTDVENGLIPVPSSFTDIEHLLPVLQWPTSTTT